MASTTQIPTTLEEFEKQLAPLFAGLEDRKAEELTEEVIAEHLLNASKYKAPGAGNSVVCTATANFKLVKKLIITEKGSLLSVFDGTTRGVYLTGHTMPAIVDQWCRSMDKSIRWSLFNHW